MKSPEIKLNKLTYLFLPEDMLIDFRKGKGEREGEKLHVREKH